MFKYKELLLSRRIFENPILHLHLRCFRLYDYVAMSKDQSRPWLSLARCIFFTGSVWLSCVLMLTRVFHGYGHGRALLFHVSYYPECTRPEKASRQVRALHLARYNSSISRPCSSDYMWPTKKLRQGTK
ncbi:blast:Odorant receptor 56a [Drosophila guanche]|uniref:Blast:Odorant receptor 56a n=1 Tax=Drosophila guanche TaxID=7266 RepID=A0A3B0J2R1_DROGU|nr:blast:Odorant receptor 56a [Drosophila guanche]